jgi:hypothetical protein
MSSRRGYETIPTTENEQGSESSELRNDNNATKKSLIQNIKEFNYRSYIQNHGLTAIVLFVIGFFVVLVVGLATFLPAFESRSSSSYLSAPILLRNAIVWDGQGEILNNVDILMLDGVINQVKQNIQAPKDAKIIDVRGHIVSPGIVDMHT